MKIGPWKTAWYCVSCKERLTWNERFDNDGRCPHCGFKGKYSGSIIDTFERGYRIVEIDSPPWWKFWVKPTTKIEYKDEELKEASY